MIENITKTLEHVYLPPGGMGTGYFGQSFQNELDESPSGAINYADGN